MNPVWRPNLTELPEQPGVYLFRDARGTILYIGKALNLRRRIASYFQRRRRQPSRLRRMIARARAVSIHETGSELEALLLESRLIKRETPPFNRLSTAYVALPFVKLTLAEPFPRLILTREFKRDGSHYLGPFPRFEIAAVVCTALQRLFPLRICDAAILPGVFPQPCEAFQVRKCAAPCLSPSTASTYQRYIDDLLALLARGHETILPRLVEERQRAADAMLFERAGHLHTLLGALDKAMAGGSLTLLPVAWRNFVVILQRAMPSAYEICAVHQGRFAGRLALKTGPHAWQELATFLTRATASVASASRDGEAVVDELRIVTGWLHRTRAQARWVHIDPCSGSAAVVQALMGTILESLTPGF
jgi:excinuclease UvrABC nuclease subunit